jgi:precorrin-6A/cobalt-precorrin-6A reductase
VAEPSRLLILGGTGEAAALAEAATARDGLRVVTSLAGRTKNPAPLAGETRTGGFGGAEGLRDYLRRDRIDLVVDATHPFAAIISANAAAACAAENIPRLLLARPAWRKQPGDRWIDADDIDGAAAALPAAGRRVFLTVGRNELARFSGVDGAWFLVRVIDPPEAPMPLADCTVVTGRGPFREAGERSLMAEHRIEIVVSKNSGGGATYAKIAAARGLGLPVIMVRRPAVPTGPAAESVDDALAWVMAARD